MRAEASADGYESGSQRRREAVRRIEAVMVERAKASDRDFEAALEAWRVRKSGQSHVPASDAAGSTMPDGRQRVLGAEHPVTGDA